MGSKVKSNPVVAKQNPKLVLGTVLFARQKAEEIYQLLNQLATHVMTNNVGLESEDTVEFLKNLQAMNESLSSQIDGLNS